MGFPWTPVRVALECQSEERVEACTWVRTLLDDVAVVAVVPRSDAQVVLYVNVTTRANDDLVHLRLVGEVSGAPGAFEQLQAVDSRAGVDAQREQLEPALLRVLAPVVAVLVPEAVTVALTPPVGVEETVRTSPWGLSVWGGGFGSWIGDYQSASWWTGVSVERLTDADGFELWFGYDRRIERQPGLRVGGREVSLAVDQTSVEGGTHVARNLDPHWTIGAVGRGGHDDPDGQYLWTGRLHGGIEHNWFASDDPRGNRLALAYLAGGQADAYHQPNVLGETRALFATHMVLLQGEVRVDTVELSADLAATAEILDPLRRYALTSGGGVGLVLGDHLDVGLSFGVTRQAIPGPAVVDPSNFEQVSRASYAEPLQVWSNVNVTVHFDADNGAQNNRFEAGAELEPTANL